jgi:hypothetical protein
VLCVVACFGMSGCKLLIPPKIMVVMMENQNYSDVIGQSNQPFTNSLAQQYGLATQTYALGHPSLPNYLAIVSGSNQGVSDDNPPSSHSFPVVPTLADQLVSGGYKVAAYAENLPSDPTNDSGRYAVRHNPWAFFPNAPIAVKDSSGLIPDLNGASPPDFVWYTPNVIDDGHTGIPTDTPANQQAGSEAFLSSFIPSVQATSWYKSGGQIIIQWDESRSDSTDVNGGNGGGGHVATIVVSQAIKAQPRQHVGNVSTAGILRSIEHVYQVPYLGAASVSASGNIDSLIYW